ncbi:hypothetical protein D3Z60_06645, partial [Lachnospiraceae bacterium]|nr:hypothetical protein [Lachnospiraceae bacterium]
KVKCCERRRRSRSQYLSACTGVVDFNKYIAFFLITIIRLQKQHYSYGIKWNQSEMERTRIKLPFCVGEDGRKTPDWNYMERFIKSLPFSEGI